MLLLSVYPPINLPVHPYIQPTLFYETQSFFFQFYFMALLLSTEPG
jgi:hypothetical protein